MYLLTPFFTMFRFISGRTKCSSDCKCILDLMTILIKLHGVLYTRGVLENVLCDLFPLFEHLECFDK